MNTKAPVTTASLRAKRERVTIDQIEREGGKRLFIFNKSNFDGKSGTIHVGHITDNGYTIHIEIPATWIPIDMSTFAPREELLKNPDFLSLVRKGVLEYCLASKADEIMATPKAEEALEEMNKRRAWNAETMQKTFAEQDGKLPEGLKFDLNKGDLETTTINPSLLDMFSRPDTEISESQRYTTVRNLLENGAGLTVDDLEYVMQKTPRDSSLAKLASDTLQELREAGA